MITGETELLLNGSDLNQYDDFFGSKKKRAERRARRKARRLARKLRRNSPTAIQERKEKRGRFFKDLGQIYHDIGGATAIGQAIDTVVKPRANMGDKGSAYPAVDTSDYTIDIGAAPEPEKEKKAIPTIVYVLGGIIVVGGIGLIIMQNQKQRQIKQFNG